MDSSEHDLLVRTHFILAPLSEKLSHSSMFS